jgi:tryptophanyl-tRNA synthetase
VSALLTTAALCSGRDERDLADDIGDAGAGALKKLTTDSVNEFLAPHRQRRTDFARDPEFVCSVLRHGNRRANVEATRTLEEVHAAMGTAY